LISHELKTIFVHIPKTAGSSIEVALNAVEQTNEGAIDEATGKFYPVTTGEEKHYDARACRKHYGKKAWHNYFKFTVVRNPWQRAHSWWWNNKEISGVVPLSFHEALITFLSPSGPRAKGLRPQVDWITSDNGKIEMDYICRFENIEHDFREVCRLIHIPLMELPQVLMENRNPASRRHYTEDYNAELIDLVAEFYSKDIAQFDYRFDR